MHELLLHATLPPSRHHQVLSVLAGIAAMQPIPILEKHMMFKPLQQLAPPGKANPNQAVGAQMKPLQVQMHGDLFYLKVVGDMGLATARKAEVRESKSGAEDVVNINVMEMGEGIDGDVTMSNTEATIMESYNPSSWTLQFRDLPDPSGRRPVTSRPMFDTPIPAEDPEKFMKAMEYAPHLTYLLRGHRLTHNAIDIRLYQLLLPSVSPKEPPQLLDPLDTYILQAALKVQDGQSLERMQEGVDQLMGLKETLKGCVALEAAERLSFDTRVKLGS